jgi:hypothetical protein
MVLESIFVQTPMNDKQPWLIHGSVTAEHEDFLIGNRAGLEALQAAIHRALAEGQANLGLPNIEFIGVRMVETDPRTTSPKPMPRRDKIVFYLWMTLGILIFAVLAYVLFVGLSTIQSWRYP